ncbi:hypothetical protein [Microbacterium maritypicum]|uniref:hypothetical protein n=1 Tax=Microbacterium maritypicum TaxID=33918 RepID=UPI003CF398E2
MTDSTLSSIARDPAITRDAKTWSRATGVKYTEALRLIEDPLHQGILGDRIVVRDLLRVLVEHPIIGSTHAKSPFGLNGLRTDVWMADELTGKLLRQVILTAEFLRLFDPVPAEMLSSEDSWAGSYQLKHTAEEYLGDVVHGYVHNGVLIWAAAVLDLPMRRSTNWNSPNVEIAVHPQQLEHTRQVLGLAEGTPDWHYYRPTSYDMLQNVLELAATGMPIDAALGTIPPRRNPLSPFHTWMSKQTHRRGLPGRVATDYLDGVDRSEHRAAVDPTDFRELIRGLTSSDHFYRGAVRLAAEWSKLNPSL